MDLSKAPAENFPVADNKVLNYKIFGAKINGIHTDIFINNYSNQYFIVLTQLQKLGTLVSVEKDTAHSEGETKAVYSTKVLLGREDDQVHAAGRFLVEQLGLSKPVIFSFGLQDLSVPVLRAICQLLKEKL